MFNVQKIRQDLDSEINVDGKVCKQYAHEIEEYVLELKKFPNEIFQIYLHLLDSPQFFQFHGIYHFFKQLYFDFEKLSPLQKQQLKIKIIECLQHPVENNLALWLSKIIQNKY